MSLDRGLYGPSYNRGGYGNYGGYGGSYGYNSYGSSYNSPYGNRYGGSSYGGSSYGYSGYGGQSYGQPYGYGAQQYGQPGQYGPPGQLGPPGPPQQRSAVENMIGNTFHYIDALQYCTDIFAQFAGLLTANTEAIYASFSSFIGLLEGLGHLGNIFKGFTAFSLLRRLWNWFTGTKVQGGNALAREFKSNSAKRSRGMYVLGLLGLAAVGLPFLILFLNKIIQILQEIRAEEAKSHFAPVPVQAIEDHRPQSPDDIEFYKGDIIILLAKPFEQFWFGEVASGRTRGMRGLFASNAVKLREDIMNKPPQSAIAESQRALSTSRREPTKLPIEAQVESI